MGADQTAWARIGIRNIPSIARGAHIPTGCGKVVWLRTVRERAAGCVALGDAAVLLSLATASEFPLRYTSSAGLTSDNNLQNARIFTTGETRTETNKDKGA